MDRHRIKPEFFMPLATTVTKTEAMIMMPTNSIRVLHGEKNDSEENKPAEINFGG